LPASSRSRSLPGWAALGPRAILAAELGWSSQARPLGHKAPHRPRSVVATPGQLAAPHRAVRQHRVSQPLPERGRHRRAPLAAVWPARSVGRSLPPKHHPAQVHGRRSPAGLPTTSAAVPASLPHRAVDRAAGTGWTTWNSTRSSRDRCPAVPGVPHRDHRLTRDETDATGRTGSQQPAGRRTGLDTSRPDTSRPDTGRAGHQPAGHQPAGRRTGWTPDGRTAASGRGSQIAGQWTGWTPDGRTPGPPTVDRPAGALAHCCRVLELDGTRGGQWDYGKVRECRVGLVRQC
jgi:hypothetical protein